MPIYTMYTNEVQTRVRPTSNTGLTELIKIPTANCKITGSELFTATAELRNTAGILYQHIGDKWLWSPNIVVGSQSYAGWVAYIHKGQFICHDFVGEGVPPPPPVPTFPVSFILTDSSGAIALYEFVRQLP